MAIDLIMCLSGASAGINLEQLTRYKKRKSPNNVANGKKLAAFLMRTELNMIYEDISPILSFDTHVSAWRSTKSFEELRSIDPVVNAEIAAATLSLSKINQL